MECENCRTLKAVKEERDELQRKRNIEQGAWEDVKKYQDINAALQAEIKALKEEDCVEFCQGIKDLQAEIKELKDIIDELNDEETKKLVREGRDAIEEQTKEGRKERNS